MPANDPPQPGRQMVASWVYAVINPLLDAIPIELSFLERGSVTWRFVRERLEFVRPLAEYIAPPARHVLDDLLHFQPLMAARFAEHDGLVVQIEQLASEAAKAILTLRFGKRVKALAKLFTKKGLPFPGGAYSEDDLPKLVAQSIVNRVDEIPDHYSDAAFWRAHRREFLRYATGEPFQKLDAARLKLIAFDSDATGWLKSESLRLRLAHDLPASQIPPPYSFPA